MGDRGGVLDDLDPQTDDLQGADGGLASRPGALDADFHFVQTVFLGAVGGFLGGHLGGVGGAFTGPLEAGVAGGGPGDGIAFHVGDGDNGVVEGRLNVNDPPGDVLLDFLFGATGSAC